MKDLCILKNVNKNVNSQVQFTFPPPFFPTVFALRVHAIGISHLMSCSDFWQLILYIHTDLQ